MRSTGDRKNFSNISGPRNEQNNPFFRHSLKSSFMERELKRKGFYLSHSTTEIAESLFTYLLRKSKKNASVFET